MTSRSQAPFAYPTAPPGATFERLRRDGFRDWRLSIEGLVARPMSLSIDEVRRMRASSQITELVCEEGWSYIAEWIGAPLGDILRIAGGMPQARYIVYFSIESAWWESIDMIDARHPQALVTYAMNGAESFYDAALHLNEWCLATSSLLSRRKRAALL